MNDIEDAALNASLESVRVAAETQMRIGEGIILANAEARVDAMMPGLDADDRQEAALAIIGAAVKTVAAERLVANWNPEKDRNCATCRHCRDLRGAWTIPYFMEEKSPGAGSSSSDRCSHPLIATKFVGDDGSRGVKMPTQHEARRKGSACGNRGILWQSRSRFEIWRSNHETLVVIIVFAMISCAMLALGLSGGH